MIAGFEYEGMKDPEQEKIVAYHEVGHALTGWFLAGGDPLLKLTIVPRSKGALGFAQYLPREIEMKTKQDMLDRITVLLGGRAAEEVYCNTITTGASDDFQKASKIATDIVTTMGMGNIHRNIR